MPRSPGSRNRKRRRRSRGRRHDRRLPASQRGYDREWYKLREWYAQQCPLCEHCLSRGHTVPMQEVDHIVPFQAIDDPLRLDEHNLQSLCRPCHAQKTERDQG